ncbi:hypothetical protein M408DRAFT_28757 [Serendipita vermifera MAFF 305830]|uniref:Uncharacterized protein n=1 Tax=Serendipita vermifera MAFF 305830 TaxID=933852 RepID=A0A0C3ACH5_SERVB|nr:hypothetical protein M408DRAFT_28757 [Serendipita vermifera MAFF 305830]
MPETTKPSTSYVSKPPSGPSYTPTPPGPTYDAKPPGPTYDSKPPSGSNYGTVPPSTTYNPTAPTGYDRVPPPTTYDSKPTYGSGNPHKDCSCGAEKSQDCSCARVINTVNINGRMRDSMKNCSFEFELPCNHIAVMYGVRTAIYEQIVDITIRRRSERKHYKAWTFEGKKDAALLTLEGSNGVSNLNIEPESYDRIVLVTFQTYANGEYTGSDMRHKEIVLSTGTVEQCSYFYNFFVEAGDDCDYHDTDFCISVLPTVKTAKC